MTDPARLARLNGIKLAALVHEHVGGSAELHPGEFPGGAALLRGDAEAWVLLAERPERGLGAAMVWALRQGAASLQLVAETATGLLARRARSFAMPVAVWHAEGRILLPAVPEPLPEVPSVSAAHRQFVDAIVRSGATPHEEFGVLSGEVRGLEVCRVVDDPYLQTTRLEVGVGAHDREAFAALHGEQPAPEALARVVDAVAQHRADGATGHPLSRLARERSMRCRLIADPKLIGATEVVAAPPPVPRTNLKDPVPCAAVAIIAGEPVAVVCSAGVDLDAVPFAVDVRAALGLSRCLLVLPTRDAIPVQHLLAGSARPPVIIVPVD